MSTTVRELAHRRTDGIDVRLVWNPATDRLSIAVVDAERSDCSFEFEVDGSHALAAFHHPYAYVAIAS